MAHHRDDQQHIVTRTVNKAAFWRLMLYVWRRHYWKFVLVGFCILIASAATLYSALFIRDLFDHYITPLIQDSTPNYHPLAQALIGLSCVLACGALCGYAHKIIMIYVSQHTMMSLRKELFAHIERLPISFFDKQKRGQLMSAFTNDVEATHHMLGESLPALFQAVITVTITLLSMLLLSVPLTFISICMGAFMATLVNLLASAASKPFRTLQQHIADLNAYVEESISGQRIVKIFSHEKQSIADFNRLNDELRRQQYHANSIANVVMPVNGNIGNVAFVLIAIIGSHLALDPCAPYSISLGTVVSFLTLNKNFMSPIAQASQQFNSIISASVGAERIFHLIDQLSEDDSGHRPLTAADVKGEIILRDLSFAYNEDCEVLHHLNLTIHPHQKVAFIGQTGCGKSTIMSLLLRFYDQWTGEILLDGVSIRTYYKKDVRSQIGMVLQDARFFTGTIYDNLRYGKPNVTEAECQAACELVGADSFIRQLPYGYSTRLEGSASNLSLGQRQLLNIARTALINPQILILDEATSCIDSQTEQTVMKGLKQLMKGRTTLIIAHRLSTIREADCICVMSAGQIVEQGTHQELLNLKGRYWSMLNA